MRFPVDPIQSLSVNWIDDENNLYGFYSNPADFTTHGFMWSKGRLIELIKPGFELVIPSKVSANGTVFYQAYRAADGFNETGTWKAGKFTPNPVLSQFNPIEYAFVDANDSGALLGVNATTTDEINYEFHWWIYQNKRFNPLPEVPGIAVLVYDRLLNSGLVFGSYASLDDGHGVYVFAANGQVTEIKHPNAEGRPTAISAVSETTISGTYRDPDPAVYYGPSFVARKPAALSGNFWGAPYGNYNWDNWPYGLNGFGWGNAWLGNF
jgi:hypothetical protein